MPKRVHRKKYPVKGLERHGRRWRWTRVIDGRRVRYPFDAANEAEAIAWVMQMEGRSEIVDAGLWEHEVTSYTTESVAAGRLSPVYGEDRKLVLMREAPRMGVNSPADLTPARIQAWYDSEIKADRLVTVTVNHYLKHFDGFCRWLVSKNKLLENPCKAVEVVQNPDNTREVYLTSDAVAELLKSAREDHKKWNERHKPGMKAHDPYPTIELFILLACECGMRKGEIDAARSEWVDLERGLIIIPAEEEYDGKIWKRKGKTGRRRRAVIPMVKELKDWFQKWGVPSPYLLKPEKRWGKNRYRYEIHMVMERFLKRHGYEHVTIHDMRRSFASNRVSAGLPMEKIANWMAIDLSTAWKRYARFIPADADIERGSASSSQTAVEQVLVPERPVSENHLGTTKERLASLKELFDEGLITELEFSEKKAEILSDL